MLVRRVVEAVNCGANNVREISLKTGFSERHVRYRLETARILGLLTDDFTITVAGQRLMCTVPSSGEEREVLSEAIGGSPIVTRLAPGLLDSGKIDSAKIAQRIEFLSGLSEATAQRRATVLRAWRRQLVPKDH